MKQLLIPCLCLTVIFAACGDKGKVKSVTKNEDGTETTTTVDMDNLKKMSENSNEVDKKVEELKKLSPMSLDQLKALVPEEVMGIKRTNYNASSAMGYAYVDGEYKKDDTTMLRVAIYDCAGETGSAMYSLNYWTKMSFQSESEKGYTKTVDFKGEKAVESYDKNSNQSTFTYVANDRLLVTLTGENIKPEALREAAGSLSFK